MATCEVCGNDYWMSFEVHTAGAVDTFDSFECAIQRLAPVCEHCRCRIIGRGGGGGPVHLLRALRPRQRCAGRGGHPRRGGGASGLNGGYPAILSGDESG